MRRRVVPSFVGLTLLSLVACGSGDSNGRAPDGGQAGLDAGAIADAGNQECPRALGPENAPRFVVVSRPYGAGGAQSNAWEVLRLSPDGTLGDTGTVFTMGRATGGVVEFTPDGEIGLVAQEDGSLGVFRIDGAGQVTVLHESLEGAFYATDVVMGATGDHAYILSENFRENGGGIYQISIGCDGTVKDEGLVVAGKLPRRLLRAEGGRSVVAAHDLGDSLSDQDLHLVLGEALQSPAASTTVFPDRDAIVGSMAMTADEDYVLLGDNSGFSGVDNRVGVARVSADGVEGVQVLTPLLDPYAMATSPFDDAAIVVSGFGDAIVALTYDASNTASPFAIAGELAYEGSAPQLPADLVSIERGDLLGLVVIAENQGLRRVRFEGGGVVTDLGLTTFGESFSAIPGALGVQP